MTDNIFRPATLPMALLQHAGGHFKQHGWRQLKFNHKFNVLFETTASPGLQSFKARTSERRPATPLWRTRRRTLFCELNSPEHTGSLLRSFSPDPGRRVEWQIFSSSASSHHFVHGHSQPTGTDPLPNRPYETCCRRNEDEAACVGKGGEKSASADQSIANASTEDDDGELGRATTLSPPTPTPTPAMKQIFSFPISSLPAPPRDRQLTVVEAACERTTEAPDAAPCRRYCLSSASGAKQFWRPAGRPHLCPCLKASPEIGLI